MSIADSAEFQLQLLADVINEKRKSALSFEKGATYFFGYADALDHVAKDMNLSYDSKAREWKL